MSQFARFRQAASGLGIPHEMEVKFQTEPRDGWMASWTSTECCAVIFGVGDHVVDFLFNGIGDFDRVRVGKRTRDHLATCECGNRVGQNLMRRFHGCWMCFWCYVKERAKW